MNSRVYFLLSGVVFLIVAVAHLSRLIGGWDIVIAGRVLARWVSVAGLIVPGVLSAWGFKLASSATTARA